MARRCCIARASTFLPMPLTLSLYPRHSLPPSVCPDLPLPRHHEMPPSQPRARCVGRRMRGGHRGMAASGEPSVHLLWCTFGHVTPPNPAPLKPSRCVGRCCVERASTFPSSERYRSTKLQTPNPNPKPHTATPKPQSSTPQTQTPYPKTQTSNPTAQTHNHQSQTPNPKL